MEKMYFDLLRSYCDALISLQFKGFGDPAIDGGFYCRSCKMIHGRNADAVYPLVLMAKLTGEKKYLDAAERAFDYGKNLVRDDGSLHNDSQSTWQGITVFNAISLVEALRTGKEILAPATREKWENRLRGEGKWLFETLDEDFSAVINYPATNTAALALIGKYFGLDEYLVKAKHLADYVMERFTENGFLYGEIHDRDMISPLGCRAIDIGYNMEESVPALVKYATAVGDEELLGRLCVILEKQLDFMLPDGAWDNSFGCRNNKWTYWGSRTSDGCASAYTLLAARNPVFAEAARRNTELLEACTHDGLLYGGPHYFLHGEYPCTHHTFEHANSIAFALEHSADMPTERASLPIDHAAPLAYYPEINTYKLAVGDYRATVTGNDIAMGAGLHAGGGTLSLLWKYGVGPMIACAVTDYRLVEAHNQQLSMKTGEHRTLVPRLEIRQDKKRYDTSYFTAPELRDDGPSSLVVKTGCASPDLSRLPGDVDRIIRYDLTTKGMKVTIENVGGGVFILPLIAGEISVLAGKVSKTRNIFFLTPGFTATEYSLLPDESGKISFLLK